MFLNFQAHDLLWLSRAEAVLQYDGVAEWVQAEWELSDPVVVRRDIRKPEENGGTVSGWMIPVGIRGKVRSQRHPLWIRHGDVVSVQTPREVALHAGTGKAAKELSEFPAFKALRQVLNWSEAQHLQHRLSWFPGIAGSLGFSIATGKTRVTEDSDLDLVIRCAEALQRDEFFDFIQFLPYLPCRADVQIQTPHGGFSLSEWIRSDVVLLKTDRGPVMVSDPWSEPENRSS